MNNLGYFNYSQRHPEELFDSFYAKEKVIIPPTANQENELTQKNGRLIELISTFKTLMEYGKPKGDADIQRIVEDVCGILNNTEYINYCAFSQFFMTCNFNFSIYEKLSSEQQKACVFELLVKYCKNRHAMYLSHGYSNTILQVMCDNYSHKRNGKTGIEKILSMAEQYQLARVQSMEDLQKTKDGYFLPDKGDKNLFEQVLEQGQIMMKSREIEQNKRPDIVFVHNRHLYICELKTMKEIGGGQNKQVVEFAHFIRFSEENQYVHYVSFLDGNYSNVIFSDQSPKIARQREDILNALKKNASNYFLNTAGMKLFLKNLFKR